MGVAALGGSIVKFTSVFAAVKTTVSGFDCVKFLCHFN
jgi:hypothetical protein